MTCTFPPPLSDAQLLTYLDGAANGEISTHLAGCAACQARAQELDRLQTRLTAGLFRVTCPPSLTLGEYEAGLLEPAEAAVIRQHLTHCPHCARELGELQGYLRLLPPVFAAERWQQLQRQTRVLVARLVEAFSTLGGGLSPVPVGIRGEQAAQLVYEAEDVQVILEVQPDAEQADRRVILGLVLGFEPGLEVRAQLWQQEELMATTLVDELGNFVLSGLVPGQYELIVSGGGLDVHIQELAVT
jgi:Putative zinc-finger